MSALVRSELLKVRTTRGWWAYLIAIVLITGIAAAGQVGSAASEDRETTRFMSDLIGAVGLAGLLALILGITVVTGEFRHGTVTPTFLAAPRRELVIAAKTVATTVVGLGFAALAVVVIAAVAGPWLAIVDASPVFDGDVAARGAKQVVSIVLSGLIGVAIGLVVHNQVAALVGTLVWIFVVENLLWGLFALLDVDDAVKYLPFRALDATGGSGGDQALSYGTAVIVSLVWIALLGAAGSARTLKRDVT